MPSNTWRDWESLEKTACQFEAATLPKPEWTHEAHLAMACWYVICDPDNALDKVRHGIRRLNEAHGVPMTPTGGYHETITIAYVCILRDFLTTRADRPPIERVWAALEQLSDKSLLLRYYSSECLSSVEARYGFVEPDLCPLP